MSEAPFVELKASQRLPSPDGIVLKVLELTSRDDIALESLAHLIKADHALTAKILKFANSPMVAPRRPIVAILDAVIRIGMKAVRNLVLSVSLLKQYRHGLCRSFDYRGYWSHSLAMAVAMGFLAERERVIPLEEAFTFGLLADIGQIALATAWPEEYAHGIDQSSGEDLIAWERQHFNLDHRELTRLLFADWNLPEIYCDALALENRPASATNERTTKLSNQIGLARAIADWCLSGEREKVLIRLRRKANKSTIAPNQLQETLEEIEKSWLSWGKLLDVQTDLPDAKTKVDSPAVSAAPVKGLEIVLVEDDLLSLKRLSKQLSAAGYLVRTYQNSEQALREILINAPQLILTEWSVSSLDGLSLCKSVRRSAVGQEIYLIMLTVRDQAEDMVKAFEVGFDDYITKSIDFNILLARIRAGERIYRLRAELNKERAELEQQTRALTLANRRLEQVANTDLLTGLPNRRYGLRRLEQEWAQVKRYKRPLSVMILDFDHFKFFNDTLGHAGGDKVLKHATKVLQQALRASDILCRWGGEEFIAILPNTHPAAASELAERLCKSLESRQPKGFAIKRPLTVSIGVAACNRGQGIEQLIHLADQALYRAKDKGRNRVETT